MNDKDENRNKEPILDEIWEETKNNIGMGIFWTVAVFLLVAFIIVTVIFRIWTF
ncbi:MAG: hypothetical protein MJ238_06305 [Bacilli bacterium]|nr:hypothetical protein [Bacilli bacterium]